MSIFKKKKKIQATTEGENQQITLESLLYGTKLSGAGIESQYQNYSAQLIETYRKYEGRSNLGSPQLRALVDTRTAFISGEGLSVQAENNKTAAWIDKFLTENKLKGSKWVNLVKGGEMSGKQLIILDVVGKITGEPKIICYRIPYANGMMGINYEIDLLNKFDFDSIRGLLKIDKMTGEKIRLNFKNFKYVRLGGSDADINETTTRVGLVLHEIESYARALNGIRQNNHLFNKIFPTFLTKSKNETSELLSWISRVKWKIGTTFIGTAQMKYESPPTTTHENYKAETLAVGKIISATTGVPIHWIGWVDIMSNRATAEELYEVINNATTMDRLIWSEAIRDVIIMAQEMSIDNGIGELKTVDKKFEVKIPLINFSKMLNYVKALSIAFNDEVISKKDYQNALPGIDPYQTQQNIEKEQQESVEKFTAEIEEEPEDEEKENEKEVKQ